jgi:hypothetical protein
MDTEHAEDIANQGVQQSRIERGAQVFGPDGTLGTVEQIVIDRNTGTLQSLVIRSDQDMRFELPADRIERASGNAVYLTIGLADLASQPDLARPYVPEQYVPVEQGTVVRPSQVAKMESAAPVLTDMEQDAVEIATPARPGDQREPAPANAFDTGMLDIEDEPTIILGAPAELSGVDESVAEEVIGFSLAPLADVVMPPEALPAEMAVPEMEAMEATLRMSPVGVPIDYDHVMASGRGDAHGYDQVTRSGEGGSGLVVWATTGVVLGAATAGLVYLLVRRRRRASPMRLAAMRTRAQPSGARDAANATLRAAGLRLFDSASTLRTQAGRAGGPLSSAAPSSGAARDTLTAATAERGRQVGKQIAGTPRRAARRPLGFLTRIGRYTAVGAWTERTRPVTRGTRRVARRARWFRRGIFAGIIGGVLYAPTSGRELRARIAALVSQVPGLGDLVGPAQAPGAATSVGGTGPHPRTAYEEGSAGPGGAGMRAPLLEPTSEEPPMPPPTPDVATDEVAGITGL